MSGSDNEGDSRLGDVLDAGVDARYKALAERVAKTADSDLKEFLSGILRTTEATLGDLKSMRQRLDKAQANADAAAAAANQIKQDAHDTAIKADIRAQAQAAGAVDPGDVMPFINMRDVRVDSSGKSNIVELLDALKKAKPHFFGKPSTSAAYSAPRPGSSLARNALEMTPAEYRAAKARFTRR